MMDGLLGSWEILGKYHYSNTSKGIKNGILRILTPKQWERGYFTNKADPYKLVKLLNESPTGGGGWAPPSFRYQKHALVGGFNPIYYGK